MQDLQQTTSAPHTLSHYTLLREAGRGGMSTVYEAEDTRIRRTVALKVVHIPPYLSQDQRTAILKRFERESRAIARLSHPSVVTIHDIGEEDGHYFLVMEYLDGRTLRERLDAGPLSPEETANVLDQVAGALDAVHAQGVVHRDLKPSNVMLLPDGRVKLMDFGVARQIDDTMVTQAGMMVGSPAYMAPEQVEGEDFTSATDVWALGILLYEMLAGRPPFSGKTIPQVLYRVTHNDPPPLPQGSAEIQQVIRRALDKDPAKRYPSAHALADAYRQALGLPLPESERRYAAGAMAIRKAAKPSRTLLVGAFALLSLVALGDAALVIHAHRQQMAVAQAPRIIVNAPAVPHYHAPVPTPVVHIAASHQEMITARTPTKQRAAMPIRRHHPVPKNISGSFRRTPIEQGTSASLSSDLSAKRVHRHKPLHVVTFVRPHHAVVSQPAVLAAPADTGGLLGTWHGTHTHNPATLVITHRHGNAFDGVMTVQTHEALVRLAVTGQASPQTGGVTLREKRVLWSSKPHAWDLGWNTGRLEGNGHMAGTGRDIKGRSGAWSFSR